MNIKIDDIIVEVFEGETILQVAQRIGKKIPAMCYAEGAEHQPSCMVCMVKDLGSGQMIPSCSSIPEEGMNIDTQSEEVREMRRLSLELLLSDHRADCEAPCNMVCPKKLDVEKMLYYWDHLRYEEARGVLATVFQLPAVGCDDCKRPCEKACRRGTVDKHVEIVEIIHQLAGMTDVPVKMGKMENREEDSPKQKPFSSRIGRFSEKEKEWLKASVDTPSTCLHCACQAQNDCKLRQYATESGIRVSRYGVSSDLPFKVKKRVTDRLWFEPAKCIRCGLCVYNTHDGFTFKGRGFGMQVVIPGESCGNVTEDVVKLCPTGALYIED